MGQVVISETQLQAFIRDPEIWGSFCFPLSFLTSLRQEPCVYCGGPSSTLEHVVPRSSGGKDLNNRVGACYECNNARANKPLLDWLIERGTINVRRFSNDGVERTAINDSL